MGAKNGQNHIKSFGKENLDLGYAESTGAKLEDITCYTSSYFVLLEEKPGGLFSIMFIFSSLKAVDIHILSNLQTFSMKYACVCCNFVSLTKF